MNKPLVFIVSINYNSSSHTIEMVNSVLNAELDNVKIVIIDNASKLEEFEKLKVVNEKTIIIRSEENLGFSGGNNLGIRYALEHQADYIMILNNDTIIDLNAIPAMLKVISEKKIDVVCPKILNYYEKKKLNYAGGSLEDYKGGICIWGLNQEDDGSYDEEKEVSYAHGCCTLASAKTWKQVHLMDERYFLYYEDVALSKAFLEAGKKIYYCPKAIIYHKESTSTQKYSDNYQYYLCRNRLLYTKEYIKYPLRIAAYGYFVLFALKNLVKRKFKLVNVINAVKDYQQGAFGKRLT